MSSFRSINPWNGEILQEYSPTTPAAVEQALAAAEHCFDSWREQSFSEKSILVSKIESGLKANNKLTEQGNLITQLQVKISELTTQLNSPTFNYIEKTEQNTKNLAQALTDMSMLTTNITKLHKMLGENFPQLMNLKFPMSAWPSS